MVSTTCYRLESVGIVAEPGWTICETYPGLCCQGLDICLDEQICHNPSSSSTNGSGYYIGLCQDATYTSPSCSHRCSDDDWGDVMYDSSTDLWACCGTNEGCNNPTDETFLAPPPEQLLAAASSLSAAAASSASAASSVSAASSASSSVSAPTITVTTTPPPVVASHSSLSTGAKAGLGVGAAIAAIAIIGLLAWAVWLRRRLRGHNKAQLSAGRQDDNVVHHGLLNEAPHHTEHKHELNNYTRPHEMEGR